MLTRLKLQFKIIQDIIKHRNKNNGNLLVNFVIVDYAFVEFNNVVIG